MKKLFILIFPDNGRFRALGSWALGQKGAGVNLTYDRICQQLAFFYAVKYADFAFVELIEEFIQPCCHIRDIGIVFDRTPVHASADDISPMHGLSMIFFNLRNVRRLVEIVHLTIAIQSVPPRITHPRWL